MKITLKLYATLAAHLPAGATRNQIELEVPAGTTPADLARQYNLPPRLTHLVLVNGHYIPPEARATTVLAEGDVLAIWPPIAGG
ncbi:MAG: MoaD/ThiS family protein [Methylophilaceae bacterium]|nr:MoaD/ThiS family protein [Methylophilaceae bacterium]